MVHRAIARWICGSGRHDKHTLEPERLDVYRYKHSMPEDALSIVSGKTSLTALAASISNDSDCTGRDARSVTSDCCCVLISKIQGIVEARDNLAGRNPILRR